MIVKSALSLSETGESVTVFSNDTDVNVMLLHFWNPGLGEIVMRSDFKKNQVKQLKQMNIKSSVAQFSKCVVSNLLVIHAFSGCDTTSAIFEKGKSVLLRLIEKSKKAQELCSTFMANDMSHDAIGKAGIKLFLLMYGAK